MKALTRTRIECFAVVQFDKLNVILWQEGRLFVMLLGVEIDDIKSPARDFRYPEMSLIERF